MRPRELALRRKYLLRIREEHGAAGERRTRRCILQEERTGQHASFGDLDALIAYLRAQLAPDAGEGGLRPGAAAARAGAEQPERPPT